MSKYVCPRCGYGTKIKTHMKKHFLRKTPCTIVNENISTQECIKLLNDNKMKKVIKNPSFSLKNPSKIPQFHSKSLKIPQNPSFFLKKNLFVNFVVKNFQERII